MNNYIDTIAGGVLTLSETSSAYYKVDVIAALFGVTVRRVQQLTQDGIISTVKTSDGVRYELAPTVQKYVKYLSDKAYGREQKNGESELKNKKLKAEIALKESQAELHQIKTAIANGQYISVEEVQLDYSHFFVVFKKFARSIPNRVGGIINGYVEPVTVRKLEKDIAHEIDDMLTSFVLAASPDGDKE